MLLPKQKQCVSQLKEDEGGDKTLAGGEERFLPYCFPLAAHLPLIPWCKALWLFFFLPCCKRSLCVVAGDSIPKCLYFGTSVVVLEHLISGTV